MSNTWEYRFAFRAEDLTDIPLEFRCVYERLKVDNGHPVHGLFTPSVKEHTLIASRRIPPKLILVFQESIAVLSLDLHSSQAHAFEQSRSDSLGFGLAEFLLNCWFTLYPGDPEQGTLEVRFPSRAIQHYWELSGLLLKWCSEEEGAGGAGFQSLKPIEGLPPKFASFLHSHPELGTILEFFFQPAMEGRARHEQSFANLLLLMTSKGIFALADQHHHERSEYGIEMTYLPERRLRTAEWIESADSQSGVIEVSMHGATTRSRLSWPVYKGLQPYVRRWIQAINRSIKASEQVHAPEGGLPSRNGNESETRRHPLSESFGPYVSSGRN